MLTVARRFVLYLYIPLWVDSCCFLTAAYCLNKMGESDLHRCMHARSARHVCLLTAARRSVLFLFIRCTDASPQVRQSASPQVCESASPQVSTTAVVFVRAGRKQVYIKCTYKYDKCCTSPAATHIKSLVSTSGFLAWMVLLYTYGGTFARHK